MFNLFVFTEDEKLYCTLGDYTPKLLNTCEHFIDAHLREGYKKIILDISEVLYVDSLFLGKILKWKKLCSSYGLGKDAYEVIASGQPLQMMELSSIGTIINIIKKES